jgi:hypothetical protein
MFAAPNCDSRPTGHEQRAVFPLRMLRPSLGAMQFCDLDCEYAGFPKSDGATAAKIVYKNLPSRDKITGKRYVLSRLPPRFTKKFATIKRATSRGGEV